jgi:hypothetical protein
MEQVARMLAEFGAIALAVGVVNSFAVRMFRVGFVRLDEVPAPMRARIRWWSRHNPAFLASGGLMLVAGLALFVVSQAR